LASFKTFKIQHESQFWDLDVKDAVLQVPQQEPLRISLGGCQWIVEKNLPGQRLEARAWFDYLAEFLEKEAAFEYCVLNPCLARNEHMALLVHVDDVMVAGRRSYIMDFFIPLIKNRFEISSDFAHPLWYKDDCIIVCHIGVLQCTCKTSGTAGNLYLCKKVSKENSCTVCHVLDRINRLC
jgi:hypothetical protein